MKDHLCFHYTATIALTSRLTSMAGDEPILIEELKIIFHEVLVSFREAP